MSDIGSRIAGPLVDLVGESAMFRVEERQAQMRGPAHDDSPSVVSAVGALGAEYRSVAALDCRHNPPAAIIAFFTAHCRVAGRSMGVAGGLAAKLVIYPIVECSCPIGSSARWTASATRQQVNKAA
jgi:hypothetical protein